MTTTTTAAWGVYYRRDQRQPWRKVGEAASEADAWRVALRYELSGDKTIARRDEDPNGEKWR